MPRVRLTRLALGAFRNHRETILKLDGRHVCLYGQNGAGKTNLLEAVSMLGPGKGLRSASLSDVTLKGADNPSATWALSAVLHDGEIDRRISVALEAEDDGRARRISRLDGAPVGQGDLAELVRIIWLTPSMDRVFAGGAGDRRRFFDRQVLAHAPGHGPAAAAYEKAMRQRNALLEQMRPDSAWLDALEQKMAEAGAAMAVFRAQALERMQAAIDQRPEGLFPKADLALDGAFERMAAASPDLNDLERALAAAFRSGRSRDAAAGRTLEGVHRTDLRVFHRPKNMAAADCSTGEQKALLIGLILANAQALFERDFAPNPLLLLDEAAAHLDSDRRAALYDELAALGGQAWLTGTDRLLFDAFGDRAQRFVVSDGQVRED
ncbi:MAG: DNA replication/repair protein RecF [Alphaproteobacteria bacterium]|nr:DNA replication/repair protein RecF [Alphaproteobacteria bacterium]